MSKTDIEKQAIWSLHHRLRECKADCDKIRNGTLNKTEKDRFDLLFDLIDVAHRYAFSLDK